MLQSFNLPACFLDFMVSFNWMISIGCIQVHKFLFWQLNVGVGGNAIVTNGRVSNNFFMKFLKVECRYGIIFIFVNLQCFMKS